MACKLLFAAYSKFLSSFSGLSVTEKLFYWFVLKRSLIRGLAADWVTTLVLL